MLSNKILLKSCFCTQILFRELEPEKQINTTCSNTSTKNTFLETLIDLPILLNAIAVLGHTKNQNRKSTVSKLCFLKDINFLAYYIFKTLTLKSVSVLDVFLGLVTVESLIFAEG